MKECITHDKTPDTKPASEGMALPVLSREGVMSNTLKIEAIAIYMELSAKYRPGHNLSKCKVNKGKNKTLQIV